MGRWVDGRTNGWIPRNGHSNAKSLDFLVISEHLEYLLVTEQNLSDESC